MTDLALAIDLGGTQIRVGLVDPSGHIVAYEVTRTKATGGAAVVMDQIAALCAKVLHGTAVKGVGMCAPGPLDTITGRVFFVQTLKGFEDFPLRDALSQRLGLPVQVENDGISGALAELCHGAGRPYSDFVYVTISTGIGGGIIADGRPLRLIGLSAGKITQQDLIFRLAPSNFGRYTSADYSGMIRELVGDGRVARATARGIKEKETLAFVVPLQGSLFDRGRQPSA